MIPEKINFTMSTLSLQKSNVYKKVKKIDALQEKPVVIRISRFFTKRNSRTGSGLWSPVPCRRRPACHKFSQHLSPQDARHHSTDIQSAEKYLMYFLVLRDHSHHLCDYGPYDLFFLSWSHWQNTLGTFRENDLCQKLFP